MSAHGLVSQSPPSPFQVDAMARQQFGRCAFEMIESRLAHSPGPFVTQGLRRQLGRIVFAHAVAILFFAAPLLAQPPRSEFLFDESPSGKLSSLFRHAGFASLDLTPDQLAGVKEIEAWYLAGAERLAELSRSGAIDAEALLTEQRVYEAGLQAKAAEAEAELIKVLGVGRFDAAVRSLNREFLGQQLAAPGQNQDSTYLLSDLLTERLQLTSDQRAQLKEIATSRQQQEDGLKRKLLVRARELQLEKLDKLLSVLTEAQRADYLDVVGKPIDWFRTDDPQGGVAAIVSAVKQGSRIRRGKSATDRETARKEFANKGISELPERFDAILWLMLASDLVRQECEMTKEQTQELDLLVRAIRDCCVLSSEQGQQRKTSLLEGTLPAEGQEQLEPILLPSQLAWLRRAELQLRLSPDADTLGLSDSDLAGRLQLTAAQAKAIREIAREFGEREQQVSESANQQLRQVQVKSTEAAFEILTESQRAKYESLVGN